MIDGDQLEQRLLDEAARIMADDLYGKDRQRMARGLQKAAEICRAAETVAKSGRWVPLYDDVWECSECEQAEQFAENIESTSRYCPNCGARMDGGTEDVDR